MNVTMLRNELNDRVNRLGYLQMLQLRSFLDSVVDTASSSTSSTPRHRTFGDIPGHFWMSDDFDATPDCFAEYM